MKDTGAKLTLILAFCAAALLLVATCYAQLEASTASRESTDPPSVQQELARMTKDLELGEAQSAAILPILEDRHLELDTLRTNGAGPEANRARAHAIFESTNREIKAMLAEAQQVAFDALRPHEPDGGTRPDRLGVDEASAPLRMEMRPAQ